MRHFRQQCVRDTFSFFVAMAIILFGRVGASAEEASDALLDEIVAGSDANIALIQRGTATYVVKRWEYSIPSFSKASPSNDDQEQADLRVGAKRGPFTKEYTVYFDYPQLRIDWRGDGIVAKDSSQVVEGCVIYDADRAITHHMPRYPTEQTNAQRGGDRGPHRGVSNPNAHVVVIEPRSRRRLRMMNPRPLLSAADEIRSLQNNPKASPRAAVEADGLIRYYEEGRGWRAERWVSPKQGYCVVRKKTWNPRFPDPVFITEATARKLDNGAYVIEHSTTRGFIIPRESNQMLPAYEEEVALVSIDIAKPPDQTLFTLEGLDLPAGATIADRIEGRTYKYRVAGEK